MNDRYNPIVLFINSFPFDIMYYWRSMINILLEHSSLYKIAYILFNTSWFETVFLGLILLVALVIIIYLFKK